MEMRVRELIGTLLSKWGAGTPTFTVEWTSDLAHGDLATNVAMVAAKELKENPRALADRLALALQDALGEDAQKVEAAGPGFVNITIARKPLAARVQEAAADVHWGSGALRAGERVAFEYSCPNPFKEMHIGHLMSTVIGEAVSRLIENQGARVLRDTYGGDIGPHVAKGIWGLRDRGNTEPTSAEEIGKAYEHGSRAYEESETAKAEIDQLNVALYELLAKDPNEWNEEERALEALWRAGRAAALNAFGDIYRVLDTAFDYTFFESETTPIGMRVVQDALEKGVFEKSEGAVIYPGEKQGLHTLVFITSRGTPTYEAKDVGLAFLKEERMPSDASYIVTGAEQIGHFTVFLAALREIAPDLANKTQHVPHGLLQLTTGKMSSRAGNVITARTLLKTVLDMALEKNPDPLIAEPVAVGALKYHILRSAPGGNIVFDPETSLSLDGDSGPYLQYALVRARSVLEGAESTNTDDLPEEAFAVERMLIRFPDIAKRAEAQLAPQQVAQYLAQLAGTWNSFYAIERIRGGSHEAYKLVLARAFVRTMENGLKLLGIPVPERM